MSKTYDCFSFFDELDLVEIRFEILDSVVDYFVVSEDTVSFAGKEKPLYFKENYDRYEKWHHKIIYVNPPPFKENQEIFKRALNSPNTGLKEEVWLREFYQKESIGLALSSCKEDDVIFISDVDEIWNPEISKAVEPGIVYRPEQECRPFYLNFKSNNDISGWTGTRYSDYATYSNFGPNHFRTEREIKGKLIPNGGWHFTWLSKQANKWNDAHPDNNTRFNNYRDSKVIIEEGSLPSYLKDSKDRWKHLFYGKL